MNAASLSASDSFPSLDTFLIEPLLPPQPSPDPNVPYLISQQLLELKASDVNNSLIHLYRGELSRMLSYRDRLDRSQQLAVTVASGLTVLSFAYDNVPTYLHALIAFFVGIFLILETRRYMFYSIIKHRVRQLETGYYGSYVLGPRYLPWSQVKYAEQPSPSMNSIKQSGPDSSVSAPSSMNQRFAHSTPHSPAFESSIPFAKLGASSGSSTLTVPPITYGASDSPNNRSSSGASALERGEMPKSASYSHPAPHSPSSGEHHRHRQKEMWKSYTKGTPSIEAHVPALHANDWMPKLLSSLRDPHITITFLHALCIRLNRVYWGLLLGVYIGWVLKVNLADEWSTNAIPAIILGVICFFISIFVYILFPRSVLKTEHQRWYYSEPQYIGGRVEVDV